MCGRFTQRSSEQAIRSAFGLASLPLFEPRYNVAPTQDVLIVREVPGEEGREAVFVRWGLIPRWAPDEKIGNRLINARSETVFEKRSFKSAVLKRR
jgi:putative SOS response-associated peptidase YedK